MPEAADLHVAPDDFSTFLESGGWSATADDRIEGEHISAAFAERLVSRYNASPGTPTALSGLGLLALMTGVAEWGVSGPDLPADPAGKGWGSDTGEDSGKHLMSYAVGGVGISHADVGDLKRFVVWLRDGDIVPEAHKPGLTKILDAPYRKKGVVYDELRAAGRCSAKPIETDLFGEPFDHFAGPAGETYCSKYRNKHLTKEDWASFRTWTRRALRREDGQTYLLGVWLKKYWAPTAARAPEGDGRPEEMLVNVRIRNSAPKVADEAFGRAPPEAGAEGRVQRQFDAYADWKIKTARRRWKLMMRPVVLYRHFSGLEPLKGIAVA